ncbi:hypothetical protein Hanom_Chr01g00060281 [Helianthus anomalus]
MPLLQVQFLDITNPCKFTCILRYNKRVYIFLIDNDGDYKGIYPKPTCCTK